MEFTLALEFTFSSQQNNIPLCICSDYGISDANIKFRNYRYLLNQQALLIHQFYFVIIIPCISPVFLSKLIFFAFP